MLCLWPALWVSFSTALSYPLYINQNFIKGFDENQILIELKILTSIKISSWIWAQF
jgi:hypothetical protein